MPSHVHDLLRMIVAYGLYDEERNALNDIGQLLLLTKEDDESPFLWLGPRRWIGLWIVMQATGDVILPMLRAWPDGGVGSTELDVFVKHSLEMLAKRADDTDASALREQARRITATQKGRRSIVFAYLEPLRELGYLERIEHLSGYGLTPSGFRLAKALNEKRFIGHNADTLLRDGLSRCFFLGEGENDAKPATLEDLTEGIENAPDTISVVPGEVPLTPLTAWIQSSLLARKAKKWIDDNLALKIARKNPSTPTGQFGIKRDERVDGVNLVWQAERKSPAEVSIDTHSETAPTLPSEEPDLLSPQDNSSTITIPPIFHWDSPSELPALLWLQYVQRRSQVFSLADEDVLRRGGVNARLAQLVSLMRLPSQHLSNKRKKTSDQSSNKHMSAIRCLHIFADRVGSTLEISNVNALLENWPLLDRYDSDFLVARLSAAQKEINEEKSHIEEKIKFFIQEKMSTPLVPGEIIRVFNDEWPIIVEYTRSFLADLFCIGGWTQDGVQERLNFYISTKKTPRLAALGLLKELLAERRTFEYSQKLQASSEWIALAKQSQTFSSSPKDGSFLLRELEENLEVSVSIENIRAATRKQAKSIGFRKCEEATARISWKLTRKDAVKFISDEAQCPDEEEEESLQDEHLEYVDLEWKSSLRAKFQKSRIDDYDKMPAPLAEAFRGLVLVEVAERRSSEKLLTVWTILEDLAKAGKNLVSYEVIGRLSRVAALILLRNRLVEIRNNAVGALVVRCFLDPKYKDLGARVKYWIPEWVPTFESLIDQTDYLRRHHLKGELAIVERPTDQASFEQLWKACTVATPCESELLQRAITANAPLAARNLADVYNRILKTSPEGKLDPSAELASAFNDSVENARAFFSEIYDARNRIVHQGELAKLHGRDAPVDMEALILPLFPLVEQILEEFFDQAKTIKDLNQIWNSFEVRAIDLSDSARLKDASFKKVCSLLGWSRQG